MQLYLEAVTLYYLISYSGMTELHKDKIKCIHQWITDVPLETQIGHYDYRLQKKMIKTKNGSTHYKWKAYQY